MPVVGGATRGEDLSQPLQGAPRGGVDATFVAQEGPCTPELRTAPSLSVCLCASRQKASG